MPTTPSTPQHIDSYSIISISGHRLTSSSGKWGLKGTAFTPNPDMANRSSEQIYSAGSYTVNRLGVLTTENHNPLSPLCGSAGFRTVALGKRDFLLPSPRSIVRWSRTGHRPRFRSSTLRKFLASMVAPLSTSGSSYSHRIEPLQQCPQCGNAPTGLKQDVTRGKYD